MPCGWQRAVALTGTVPAAGEILPASAALSNAELRSVTVLFADVQGSTSMIQDLDPEQVAHLMGPVLDIMGAAAERHDGEVSSRGDGIRATFGPPRSAENHALRACLCALSILDQLAGEDSTVKVRIGIHSGNVVIQGAAFERGRVREMFGNTIHIAARMEQTAEAGTACISADTFELVRGFVHVAPAPPVMAKGIAAPLQRFHLLGLDTIANRWRARAAHGLLPMVGRQAELAKLRRLLSTQMPPGLTLVRVSGPAGSGKSRLVHEFLQAAEVRSFQTVILSGNRQRRDMPLSPVVDWLLELMRTRFGEIPSGTGAHAASCMNLLGLHGAVETQRIEALLSAGNRSLIDLPEIVRGDLDSLATAILAVMRGIAGSQPVLLVCEDIDNFDQESINLLSRLPGFFADRPVLLLATSRSRSRLRLEPLVQSISMELQPLDPRQSRSIVSRISKEIASHPATLDAILAKAGGNPLFIEEICILVRDNGKHGARIDAESDALDRLIASDWKIPDRVETIIADRVSRLPRRLQVLLRLCSVVGREVPLWLIARLLRQPESVVHEQMARLEGHQVLFEDNSSAGGIYQFKHELMQEVVYRSILDGDRVKIHAEITGAIESADQGTTNRMLELLCFHAVEGRIWPKAVRYLQQMAVSAAERCGFRSAKKFLRNAQACCKHLPDDHDNLREKLSILLGLHVLAILDLRYEEGERLLDEAEILSEEIGDREMLITAMGRRARSLNVVGRLDEAVALARRAYTYASQSNRPGLVPFAAHFLAQTLFFRGELTEANAILTSTITHHLAEPTNTRLRLGSESISCLTTRGAVRSWLADFRGALEDCDEALRVATAEDRRYDMAFACFGRGLALLHQRELTGSATEFRRAVQIAVQGEVNLLLPTLQTGMAHALLRQGKFAAAEPLLLEVIGIPLANSRRMIRIWAMIGLAWHRLRNGERAEARDLIESATDDAARLGYRVMLVEALRTKSLVLLAQPTEGASACAREALGLARELGMAAEEVHCQLALASVASHRDTSLAPEALTAYRNLQMDGWARRVRHGLSHDPGNAWCYAF